MVEKLYEALKAVFDADSNLSTAFGVLYEGEPPDPTDKPMPLCTLVTGEDSKEERDFGGTSFWEEVIVFRILAETLEETNAYDGYLRAVFDNKEADITVTGLTIMDIHKIGGEHIELEYGEQIDQRYQISYYITA